MGFETRIFLLCLPATTRRKLTFLQKRRNSPTLQRTKASAAPKLAGHWAGWRESRFWTFQDWERSWLQGLSGHSSATTGILRSAALPAASPQQASRKMQPEFMRYA